MADATQPSDTLSTVLGQCCARYRNALLLKSGIVMALAGGCLALLAWHLSYWRVPAAWRMGTAATLMALVSAGVGWWMHRRWVSSHATAAYVDHALGLQQRLTTAAEFAQAPQPPLLYGLLVEDMQQRWTANDLRVPRLVDRATIAIAALLVLLLLWPHGGKTALQFAQLPRPATPPPRPDLLVPPQQNPQDQQRTGAAQQSSPSASSQSQQSSGDGSASPQPQQGGIGQPQPSSIEQSLGAQQNQAQNGSPSHASGQQIPQPNQGNQPQGTTRPSPEGTSPEQSGQSQRGAQQMNSAQQPSKQGQSTQGQQQAGQQGQQGPSGTTQANAQSAGQSGQQGTNQSRQSAGQQGQGQSPQSSATRQSASTQGKGAQQSNVEGGQQSAQAASMAQQQSGSGAGQSSVGQDALKADIQQLLKEVSGELKQLQTQMDAAQHQPQIGTGTDPNLYDAPTPVDVTTGSSMPVQLQTDQATTKTPRPGSGVGRPSGEVSAATPQAKAEAAQLSDQPLEETPVPREAVPPEYRPIFDRLHQQTTQPSEQTQ
ncbi:MAG: DUF202 domain-containing protein [Candidatus Omnitrophica bacterium]|nr:DUF202 domain-containing protein [Candidatus Omnitrophota bacterium]